MPVISPAPWMARRTCRWRRAAKAPGTARRDRAARRRAARGSSFPRDKWRSRARSGPPSAAAARRAFSSAASRPHASALSGAGAGSRASVLMTATRFSLAARCGGNRVIRRPPAVQAAQPDRRILIRFD